MSAVDSDGATPSGAIVTIVTSTLNAESTLQDLVQSLREGLSR